MNKQQLITELQTKGLQLVDRQIGANGRKGGAGPSDHKAIAIDGTTVMVPVFNSSAASSPYKVELNAETNEMILESDKTAIAPISFPKSPSFYNLTTSDGIPYWKIALLHSHDVLATTVLQTCMRYNNTDTSCQFCAIGQSLEAGRTISRKTPAQLAEVAEAAVRLDGVKKYGDDHRHTKYERSRSCLFNGMCQSYQGKSRYSDSSSMRTSR
jgi:radical SAM protein (TIGR04043 family)